MATVAVVNQKGGVAKTTSVANLGALVAEHRRVLLVDWDPQAALTACFGIDPETLAASAYDAVVAGTCSPQDALHRLTDRLYLLPASLDLAVAEVQLQGRVAREHVLRRALQATVKGFDVVLIDCPPSLGLLSVNALAAADGVLVPVSTSYLALRGLRQLLQTVDLVREALQTAVAVLGVLPTMHQRTRHAADSLDALREALTAVAPLLEPIPRSVRVEEAAAVGKPVIWHAPRDRAADAYRAAADALWPEKGDGR